MAQYQLRVASVSMALCLATGFSACGSDARNNANTNTMGTGGMNATGGTGGNAAGSGSGGGGATSGGSGGGQGGNTPLDAGLPSTPANDAGSSTIVYEMPQPPPIPPEPGDALVNEGESASGLVFPPDAGLVADAGSVAVGEVDPAFGEASACLHVDLEAGGYLVVPDSESPDARLEPIVSFVYTEEGFRLFTFNPWQSNFIVPASAPAFLPTDFVTTVEVDQGSTVLRLRVQVQGARVAVLSIVVVAI